MKKLYNSDKTQQIDRLAADHLGVDSFELMQLAGAAVYQYVKDMAHLLVITGPGNNGGDGFVIAELARQHGQKIQVLALSDVNELTGDASLAAEAYQGEVTSWEVFQQQPELEFEVIVDAMFGTGLNRAVEQPYSDVINWINQQQTPVISVDIPSGLNGSSGQVEGTAVQANKTVSILTQNTGLFTLDGKDCCGDVVLETLGVQETVYQDIPVDGLLLSGQSLNQIKQQRKQNSHKGSFGHVITAGGQAGMLGAVLLAGKAALKAGAGSTTIVTHSSQASSVPLYAPEIMSQGFDPNDTNGFLDLLDSKTPDVILLGMGLGRSDWSKNLYKSCLNANLPLVIDADGLTLLSKAVKVPSQLKVITPHPKEAAVLLNITTAEVQQNRWQAVKQLAKKYNCVAVLKGSGTLIADGEQTWCCPYGNANLATAGTGDVLAGMIAGLLAQGFDAKDATCLAVVWHAISGENSRFGLSLTAVDLLDSLHEVWAIVESEKDIEN